MHSDVDSRHLDESRRALRTLAEGQHGVAATRQLRALHLSPSWIARAARQGHLIRLHRGVYVVGHARQTLHGRWLAAVLACGEHALLSHNAAAALHELRTAPGGLIDVTARTWRHVPTIRAHITRVPDPRTTIDAVPVTTLERTLLDYAAISRPRQLNAALDAAQRSGRLKPRRIRAAIDAALGHHGAARLTHALSERFDEPPWTQSDLERDFLALVREAGLPEPRCSVLVDGILVDFYWPQFELVIEVDSYGFHRGREQFESDRANDTIRALAGRRTIRPTYRRIHQEAPALQRDLSRLLASGRP